MAASETFELSLSRTFARTLHSRAYGDVEREFPWDTLQPAHYAPHVAARARDGWTQAAYGEFCSVVTMGELVSVLAQPRVPVDLLSLASRFAGEEALHAELCARVATRLGGAVPLQYDPDSLLTVFTPDLTFLER